MYNPFQSALEQLKRAANAEHFDPEFLEGLSLPQREVVVSIPVLMDDGTTHFFEGYRVQHNNARGPYKGGIRFHPETNLDEVRALALWMSMKTALSDLPMGGGKGGVTVDPKKLSQGELERLSRGFVRALYPILGPDTDVPAPDVNTTPQIMAWMVDEYAKLTGDTSGATFTGKPIEHGGSEGRGQATGLGGFYVFDALREKVGLPEVVTVAIQGMGNVGGHAAEVFVAHGHKVVAMSDSKGGIYREAGLNPKEVEAYKKEHGSLALFPDAEQITNAQLLLLPVDVLVPAALENQITDKNAAQVQAKLVLELANGPTTPEADDILHSRGISVVPDILANSGGVIVSTFEWQQNRANEHWSEEEVLRKLKEVLEVQTSIVWEKALALGVSLRTAAFVVALERIATASGK